MKKSALKTTASKKQAVKKPVSTAAAFVELLQLDSSDVERKKAERYFQAGEPGKEKDIFIGVRMGKVFALAKQFIDMPVKEIEQLLKSDIHEVRVGGVSIMDWQARRKNTSEDRKKALFELYIRCHDRINHWGMVDRSAPYVVGGYLFNKPRTILYKLARSKNTWERRTAIVSTYYFIRQGDIADTFKIAALLVNDREEMIQTAVGGWIREAGKRDQPRLLGFLNKYAVTMPRTALRYATEQLDPALRKEYLAKNARKKNESKPVTGG